ncbi:autophagy-related protein 18b isoform X2 [Punica granatum]|uniref:Autophagy-related protein 18b isoform X2 n=1 Tax=Punica granatum TaxID=22663 RepID=A0A6P8CYC4_PUNGR|nr:autophagy-related protein 18b isoform X2 [Punica granatum]
MSNPSSAYPILYASFNQDSSCFVVGTRDGFKIFDSNTGKLLYERAMGAFIIVEMLFNTSLLAIVGAGEQPSLSPRRLVLFNTTTGTPLRELNFLTSVLAIRLNRKRLVVVLQDKTFIYDTNSVAMLDTVDTVPNLKGICAFSPNSDGCFLALPASTTRGLVLVYNVMELRPHCEIDAHRSPLAAMVLSSDGKYLATASEQGTLIRVYLVSEATKSFSFRRGTYPSTIYSLSFGPPAQLPDLLAATSSSGAVHIFCLELAMNQSYAVIRKVVKESGTSTSDFPACRVTMLLIAFTGYFQEYSLSINNQNESSWSLEREFNLLTVDSSVATRS